MKRILVPIATAFALVVLVTTLVGAANTSPTLGHEQSLQRWRVGESHVITCAGVELANTVLWPGDGRRIVTVHFVGDGLGRVIIVAGGHTAGIDVPFDHIAHQMVLPVSINGSALEPTDIEVHAIAEDAGGCSLYMDSFELAISP